MDTVKWQLSTFIPNNKFGILKRSHKKLNHMSKGGQYQFPGKIDIYH
jgi:hypothetical protein